MSKTMILYSTFANRSEAISTAEQLLKKKLVACANIFPHVTSLYLWNGETKTSEEAILIAKTSAAKLAEANAALTELHSYEVPCILSWEAEANDAFAEWINSSVIA